MKHTGLNGSVSPVRSKEEVAGVDALVVPGGESTTIGKLMQASGVDLAVEDIVKRGSPVMGTCAGLVMLSSGGCEEVEKTGQTLLGLADVVVERNAFGRQKESFEADIEIPVLGGGLYHAVFIRAPAITHAGKKVSVLASYNGKIVAAEQGNILLLSFHPELSGDMRMHEYFLSHLKK